jgi:hypothetical protein
MGVSERNGSMGRTRDDMATGGHQPLANEQGSIGKAHDRDKRSRTKPSINSDAYKTSEVFRRRGFIYGKRIEADQGHTAEKHEDCQGVATKKTT